MAKNITGLLGNFFEYSFLNFILTDNFFSYFKFEYYCTLMKKLTNV